MDKICIKGGGPLRGEVKCSGSKNAALPLLFSSLLAEGTHVFHNVPRLKDIETSCLLLEHLGCSLKRGEGTLMIENSGRRVFEAPYQLVRQMRAGVLSLGPLLAKWRQACVSLPGGCAIGTRAVDLHLKGLRQMGACIEIKNGSIVGTAKEGLKGTCIVLDFPTVGGTENLMMAACLAEGSTVIENAACEPEIVDLAGYLNQMGTEVKGAGTDVIKVCPRPLRPAEYRVSPDRIEAGTLLLAAAITGGSVRVRDCIPSHLDSLLFKLKEAGFDIQTGESEINLRSPGEFNTVDIVTAPYPGFPTDLQAQFTALLTQAKGVGSVKETIFENRFMHIQELARLGASIRLDGHTALVKGGVSLQGAEVTATDLRASACLILVGLVASGCTIIHRVYHLDRGYENLEGKLARLGADIKRISVKS